MEDVEPSVEKDPVVLERERPLCGSSLERGDPGRELGVAVGSHEAADELDLLVGRGGVVRADGIAEAFRWTGRREVDLLEEHVRRVADLGRGQSRLTGNRARARGFPKAHDALRIETVRTALEEGERAVRETTHPVLGRLGHRLELRQLWRFRNRGPPVLDGEQGELRVAVGPRLHFGGRLLSPEAIEPENEPGAVALDLQRALTRFVELGRVQSSEHPADRRRLLALPLAGSATRKPSRPSGRQRISSASRAAPWRPASATTTTLNSSPFAPWIVSRRMTSVPSSSATASNSAAPTASWSRTKRTKPSTSRPRSSS